MNPTDADQLEKSKGRLLEILARANTVEIRPDAAISRGGCVVVTELGSIDATLDRQIDALVNAVESEFKEASLGEGYGDESELDPEDYG